MESDFKYFARFVIFAFYFLAAFVVVGVAGMAAFNLVIWICVKLGLLVI